MAAVAPHPAMRTAVHYLPILTTLVSIVFGTVLYRRWREKPGARYLFWWFVGVAMFGVGTFTEAATTLLGWNLPTFKAWYISGALLGGAPLAQGTVHLLTSATTARRLDWALVGYVAFASVFVLLSPVDLSLVEPHRLSGKVLAWQWVRLFSPFVNLYAVAFLIGGAIWSAVTYWREEGTWLARRAIGNVFIAVGAILPGIGGSAARMDHVEVLYITELSGLILIWIGYAVIVRASSASIHAAQRRAAASAGSAPSGPASAPGRGAPVAR